MDYEEKAKLESFVKYCQAHPEQRFWQALRNWSKYDFILGWDGEKCDGIFDHDKAQQLGLEDTFYLEDKEE